MWSDEVILSAEGITKVFPHGDGELEILRGIDLEVKAGEALCILGASGSGKSTLMHILGTIDAPTKGEIFYRKKPLFSKNEKELARFRNESMGFVFQFHHLLPEFNALENIMMPALIRGMTKYEARQRALKLLERVGLQDRADHYPSELSGGEQQRVAIARALVLGPSLLLADEPTGNLDSGNTQKIQELFFELKDYFGITLISVTHDSRFAAQFPRKLEMADGRLKTV